MTPPLSLSLSLCSKIQGEDEAEGAGWADCHTTSICTKRKLNKNQSNPVSKITNTDIVSQVAVVVFDIEINPI